VRTEPGQQGADRVTVADHHAVDVPHLAGLRADAEPPGRADQREGSLRAGAGHLQRRRTAGLGQRTMRQEGAPPCSHRITGSPGHDRRRKAADRPATVVDEPGLPGQRVTVADHANDVLRLLPDAGR
jgi:hypothetical protein